MEHVIETPQYFVELPYPSIQVSGCNRLYARAMQDNIGGSNSEMSAVCQYFYGHLVAHQSPEIALAFQKISMVEMHHLKIFGELARQLGGDPRFWTHGGSRMVYWSPSYVPYSPNVRQLLRNAILAEKSAIQKYQRQATIIQDDNIVENLRRIILDEQLHIEILQALCQQLCSQESSL